MTRHTVDTITSDALDALYERLEAAEETESQRQLATAREAFASATTRATRAEAALARIQDLADEHPAGIDTALVLEALPDRPAPSPWLLAGTRDLRIPEHHRLTAAPVAPEVERAATARARQAAADSERAAEQLAALSAPATGRTCPCGRTPDPGICPNPCGPNQPAGGHCACLHETSTAPAPAAAEATDATKEH